MYHGEAELKVKIGGGKDYFNAYIHPDSHHSTCSPLYVPNREIVVMRILPSETH
jgi:hypothetical protein